MKAITGRNRWVQYADNEFNASQVPAEWHSWLHYSSNIIPLSEDAVKYLPSYHVTHRENPTGTDAIYTPPHYLRNSKYRPVWSPIKEYDPKLQEKIEENKNTFL
eukprot:TRINITY_DN3875_c0_g1_i2.p1 TRINITY_DN3875_c0_g1~~TRINITY_DN3875_c0_g1_i2.p1  ORF type:complete len:104 (-),score=21.71 TRINITY_DN3875_c0_g1_i2:9-320(-)